jgi:excisionase family DNA binding protein
MPDDLEKVLDIFSALLAAKLAVNLRNQVTPGTVQLYTIKEVSTMIGRSVGAVQHLVARGDIPSVKSGRRVHVEAKDLERWVKMNKENGNG